MWKNNEAVSGCHQDIEVFFSIDINIFFYNTIYYFLYKTVKYFFILQNIVLFYKKSTDIDVFYQEIYTGILVLSVFFIMKTFKNIFLLFIQIIKNAFFLCLSFKKHHIKLCCCYLFLYIGKAWHAMLACCWLSS